MIASSLLQSLFIIGIFGLPIIFGTLLTIDRRDLTSIQAFGLLMLIWLIPVFGFISALAYLFFVVPRRR